MANSSTPSNENIQWMYEGPNSKIDREAYLLGKRITKAPEDKGDFIVEEKVNENLSITVLEKLDYESKLREDPLISIRQKEQAKRKELLSNPVKRKHLQNMLKDALEKDLKRSSKHKKKKHKKTDSDRHKSRKRRQSSSSELSSDEGHIKKSSSSSKILENAKSNKNLQQALKDALMKDLGDSTSSESDSDGNHKKSKHKHKSKDKKKKAHAKKSLHRSPTPEKRRHEKIDKKTLSHSSDCDSPKPKRYGLIVVKEKEKLAAPQKYRPPSPEKSKPKYQRRERPGFTKKLTKEELEQKRREMMDNAGWRDDQRKKNIKEYSAKEKSEREQEAKVQKLHDMQQKRDGKAKTFLHDVKLKSANVGSLEDTVRRKRHTLNKHMGD